MQIAVRREVIPGGDCLLAREVRSVCFFILAAVARYSADHWGIKFDSVEPFNEPSADWWKYPNRQEGCHFDVATQRKNSPEVAQALLIKYTFNDIVVCSR